MSTRLGSDLDRVARLVRSETRAGRIPLRFQGWLRNWVVEFVSAMPAAVLRSETVGQSIANLNSAINSRRAPLIYDRIHELRLVVSRYISPIASSGPDLRRYVETGGDLAIAESRIAQLEAALQELRKQQQLEPTAEESEDAFENMAKKFTSSKNRVFVIMPFSEEFDDVWLGGIKKACQTDFSPLRVDKIRLSSWITEDIKQYVEKATTVVADITGNNANVMFELGYALGRKKDAIIIMQPQESSKVPFDISGIRHLDYADSWQGIEQLAKELRKFLTSTLERQKERKRGS